MTKWMNAIEEVVLVIDERNIGGGKGLRKFTSFRNRSPTGHSPATKTRKSSTDQVRKSQKVLFEIDFKRQQSVILLYLMVLLNRSSHCVLHLNMI